MGRASSLPFPCKFDIRHACPTKNAHPGGGNEQAINQRRDADSVKMHPPSLPESYNKRQRIPIGEVGAAMKKPPVIERECGVPIPGKILDPAHWTKTALKKLPPEGEGPLDLVALFGRRAPLIVDLGCRNGRFLLASALARPDYDHIGVDILP